MKLYRPEYHAWHQMRQRCNNPRCASYKDYGARGIRIAPYWLGKDGYATFLRDLGPRPTVNHSLERLDVNSGYHRQNCVWALRSAQASNTRATRWITLHGERRTFKQWADHYGLRDSLVHTRINLLGWDVEKAFTTPVARTDQATGRYPEDCALRGARQRCHNPAHPQYANYGGRGIVVCAAWRGRGGLAQFIRDLGKHPGPGFSLERIDVNKGYQPDNCRWATRQEQLDNRRCTRTLAHEGRTLTYAAWSRHTGIDEQVIRARLARGWPVAKTLTQTPLQKRRAVAKCASARSC